MGVTGFLSSLFFNEPSLQWRGSSPLLRCYQRRSVTDYRPTKPFTCQRWMIIHLWQVNGLVGRSVHRVGVKPSTSHLSVSEIKCWRIQPLSTYSNFIKPWLVQLWNVLSISNAWIWYWLNSYCVNYFFRWAIDYSPSSFVVLAFITSLLILTNLSM